MTDTRHVRIQCKISRGGFSGEKVFRMQLADGTEHVGAAPTAYCYDAQGRPLGAGGPPAPVAGLLTARIIERYEDGTCLVSVPSGEVLRVRALEFRPA